MGKQGLIGIVVLLAGLGGGFGVGYFVYQPQVAQTQAEKADLEAAVEAAKAQSEETVKKAGEQIAAVKADLERTRSNAIRVNTDLRKANLENQRLKALLEQTMKSQTKPKPVAADETVKKVEAATAKELAAASTKSAAAPEPGRPPSAASAATREYTIADGDSLWKIAANELGNGIRYKEILALNSGMTENTKLNIGMKINLPAK